MDFSACSVRNAGYYRPVVLAAKVVSKHGVEGELALTVNRHVDRRLLPEKFASVIGNVRSTRYDQDARIALLEQARKLHVLAIVPNITGEPDYVGVRHAIGDLCRRFIVESRSSE